MRRHAIVALYVAYALLVAVTGWLTWRIETGFDHIEDLTCTAVQQEVRAAVLQIELDENLSDEAALAFADELDDIVAVIDANCG